MIGLPLLNEEIVTLAFNHLKENFNTWLSTADHQYSDGISLERVENERYYISDKIQPLKLPAIFMLYGESAVQYTDNPNYFSTEDQAIFVLSFEDMDAEKLTRKGWRYSRVLFGVLNLLEMKDAAGRLQAKIIPQRIVYTDPVVSKLQKSGQKFRMDVVLEVKILHYEKNEETI
jgi:hypothetical protein